MRRADEISASLENFDQTEHVEKAGGENAGEATTTLRVTIRV